MIVDVGCPAQLYRACFADEKDRLIVLILFHADETGYPVMGCPCSSGPISACGSTDDRHRRSFFHQLLCVPLGASRIFPRHPDTCGDNKISIRYTDWNPAFCGLPKVTSCTPGSVRAKHAFYFPSPSSPDLAQQTHVSYAERSPLNAIESPCAIDVSTRAAPAILVQVLCL